mmetsp:Transcript_2227/g.8869  ORF Transcript_2227/g.8869 Transcript_2227/m.8869 type:complete len:232 (-) Transcript_2227:346-1041(-)
MQLKHRPLGHELRSWPYSPHRKHGFCLRGYGQSAARWPGLPQLKHFCRDSSRPSAPSQYRQSPPAPGESTVSNACSGSSAGAHAAGAGGRSAPPASPPRRARPSSPSESDDADGPLLLRPAAAATSLCSWSVAPVSHDESPADESPAASPLSLSPLALSYSPSLLSLPAAAAAAAEAVGSHDGGCSAQPSSASCWLAYSGTRVPRRTSTRRACACSISASTSLPPPSEPPL